MSIFSTLSLGCERGLFWFGHIPPSNTTPKLTNVNKSIGVADSGPLTFLNPGL